MICLWLKTLAVADDYAKEWPSQRKNWWSQSPEIRKTVDHHARIVPVPINLVIKNGGQNISGD
jgi:hypothetical protein